MVDLMQASVVRQAYEKRKISISAKDSIDKPICNHIPRQALGKIVRKHGVKDSARTLECWSHLVVVACPMVSHGFGLNQAPDQTDTHSGVLSIICGARRVQRNTFSHANKMGPATLAKELSCDRKAGHIYPRQRDARQVGRVNTEREGGDSRVTPAEPERWVRRYREGGLGLRRFGEL